MFNRFYTRTVCPKKKMDKLVLISSKSKSFHNIRRGRFRRASYLTSFLISLERGKRKSHSMNFYCKIVCFIINLQILIPLTHNASPSVLLTNHSIICSFKPQIPKLNPLSHNASPSVLLTNHSIICSFKPQIPKLNPPTFLTSQPRLSLHILPAYGRGRTATCRALREFHPDSNRQRRGNPYRAGLRQ